MSDKKERVRSVAVHYKPQKKTLSLEKKASNDVAMSRMPFGSQGFDGLKTMNGSVMEHCHAELRWPQCLKTYQQMALEPTIASVLNFYNMMIARSEFKFIAPTNASKASKDAADFLNYCMFNMEDQTWQQFLSGVGTYRVFGFSIAEKCWTTVTTGKYKGKIKWKRLAPRSQDSIDKWKWDKNDPEKLTGVVQKVVNFDSDRYASKVGGKEVTIDRGKFMLFRFDPQKNNPQGTSPLDGCWYAWKYLQIAREYQAIGLAKQLGGTPIIGIPVETLIEAANDPTGAKAAMIERLKESAAKLHAGDQAFIIKPIDYDDSGNSLYTFDLAKDSGGSSQKNTTEVIQQLENEILTVYSASLLKMGQNSTGSFALSDNMNSLLGFGVQHNLQIICDQINEDLIPQTLAINGYFLEEEEMPYLSYEGVLKPDLESLSKYVQRLMTSNAMTSSKELDKFLHEYAGMPAPTYEEDEAIPEEFKSGARTGASQSNGTSGYGGSQQSQDYNAENTA